MPPDIVPVAESIVAPSAGAVLKVKVPPVSPIIVAVAPSQVPVTVNEGSSAASTFKASVLVSGHAPVVVYSIV